MRYSIFKYGCQLLSDIEDLEQAKKEVLSFVASTQNEFVEIRDSGNETVTIGYFDGRRFHWTKDKGQTEASKSMSFVTKPPLWRGPSKSEGMIL